MSVKLVGIEEKKEGNAIGDCEEREKQTWKSLQIALKSLESSVWNKSWEFDQSSERTTSATSRTLESSVNRIIDMQTI